MKGGKSAVNVGKLRSNEIAREYERRASEEWEGRDCAFEDVEAEWKGKKERR